MNDTVTQKRTAGSLLASLLLAIVSGCASDGGPLRPSAEQRSALAVVEALFAAMATRDVAAIEPIVVPEGVFVVALTEGGKRLQRSSTLKAFLEQIGSGTSALDEHFTETPRVLVDGDIAVVWGRYVFAVDGKPSHTGIDAIHLIRTDTGWKIAGGAYSVIREEPTTTR